MLAQLPSGISIAYENAGLPPETAPCLIIWGHGWGQNRAAFRPFTETLAAQAAHLLIDFPGFGCSPLPQQNWHTEDYADAIADFIRPYRGNQKIIWVGHSFGGRVGIQLAARHPELVNGLILIAAAGLPRRRSLWENIRYRVRLYSFKLLKHLTPLLGLNIDRLRQVFGSADYQSAGAMRQVFLNTIRENLTEPAKQIKCPTRLIYGLKDRETPPDIGERLAVLITGSQLEVLPEQDHYSLLSSGRHLVIKRIADLMRSLK